MSEITLTAREREYLDCQVPLLSGSTAAMRFTGAFFASIGQAFLPGIDKADSKMIRTARELRYTKFKKAVLRKRDGTPKKGDDKLLEKLNRQEFVLAFAGEGTAPERKRNHVCKRGDGAGYYPDVHLDTSGDRAIGADKPRQEHVRRDHGGEESPERPSAPEAAPCDDERVLHVTSFRALSRSSKYSSRA